MTSRIRRGLAPREPPVRLLTHYDAVVDCIVHEMDRTAAGDRVEFSVYVLERRDDLPFSVLARHATRRRSGRSRRLFPGLFRHLSIHAMVRGDGDVGRKTQRARRGVSARPPSPAAPRLIPTHASHASCPCVAAAVPTAVFGGVNDRFRDWRDFAIRCEGRAAVGALALAVNGPVAWSRRPNVERPIGASSSITGIWSMRNSRMGGGPGGAGAGRGRGGSVDGGGGHARARIARVSRVSSRLPRLEVSSRIMPPPLSPPGRHSGRNGRLRSRLHNRLHRGISRILSISRVVASLGRWVRGTGTRPRTRRRAQAV